MPDNDIVTLDRVELTREPWAWAFAAERRAEIDRYFAELMRRRAGVWNGRALLVRRYAVAGGVLRGACFETDYASFCAWRDWRFPDSEIANVFAAAALQGADGGYLVGEMAPETAAAGTMYFPSGTPEPADIGADGTIDLAGNLRRELREETGLALAELDVSDGWTLVRDRCYLALLKRVTALESAQELHDRIMRFLAAEPRPEFADIRIVRSAADFRPQMPFFVTRYLEHVWAT